MAIISNATTIADAGSFSVSLGSLTLIKSLRASNAGTLSFVHGASSVVLDGTYPIYMFRFVEIHPGNNDVDFTVNFRDGGSNYDATKTSSYFRASHGEDDSPASLQYETAVDLAQATGVQKLSKSGIGNGGDESLSGELMLFNPSSTTFVKHFIAKTQYYGHDDQSSNDFIAGYCNVTAAIDAVQFAFTGGNIESGKVQLYGIKDS